MSGKKPGKRGKRGGSEATENKSSPAETKTATAAAAPKAEQPKGAGVQSFAAAAAKPAASPKQASESKAASSDGKSTTAGAGDEKKEDKTSKDYYFDSYSHFGIHEEMLKDDVRTRTYMRAIINNKHLFKGKIVLDVGCGTGILSMFCAKAGAKHVYGVDMASIITQAKQIVADNGFADQITLLRGKVEEIQLPVDKVDIIVSEWMGYFLLYESMLDTVLYARDKWLAKDGLIFPDKASLHVVAIEDAEYRNDKIDFWDNVFGFNMSCIKELALTEPLVDTCEPKQIISEPCQILDVDIYTVKKEDLDFKSKFDLKITRDDYCHALVAYFEVVFSKSHTRLTIPTGPRNLYTHWKQTVFYLEDPVPCKTGDNIKGNIAVNRNAGNPRDLDIAIETELSGSAKITQSKHYRLR